MKIEEKNDIYFSSLANDINNISEGLENSIEQRIKSERMKSELITNVSHDLKTPLTSIINYVELIKKEEDLQPEYLKDYVKVLDNKSKRLKVLIEDLFEASKASTGNIELELVRLDLKQLLQIFWEKKLQIVLIVFLFAIVGIVYTLGFVTPKYQATTSLLLATNSAPTTSGAGSSITTSDVTLNSKLVSTYSKLVKSDRVVRSVISNLSLNMEEGTLKKIVSVTAAEDTEFIEIAVKNEDPVLATKIANEIAKVFLDNVKEFYGVENVHVVDAAEVPQSPCNINHAKDVVIFAAIGAVIAVMYILLANMLDNTIKTPEDIEDGLGLPVLATIPMIENFGNTKGERKK